MLFAEHRRVYIHITIYWTIKLYCHNKSIFSCLSRLLAPRVLHSPFSSIIARRFKRIIIVQEDRGYYKTHSLDNVCHIYNIVKSKRTNSFINVSIWEQCIAVTHCCKPRCPTLIPTLSLKLCLKIQYFLFSTIP